MTVVDIINANGKWLLERKFGDWCWLVILRKECGETHSVVTDDIARCLGSSRACLLLVSDRIAATRMCVPAIYGTSPPGQETSAAFIKT
jgi:hypothetical protein